VVTAETLSKPIRERRGRPLFLIDLSVPRDIDPEVKRFESVYLHDLDALQRLAESGKAKRREQLEVCYLLVDRHVNELFAQAPHYLPAPGSGDVNPSTTS
jgi:glutamyl-tRNA reductase